MPDVTLPASEDHSEGHTQLLKFSSPNADSHGVKKGTKGASAHWKGNRTVRERREFSRKRDGVGT